MTTALIAEDEPLLADELQSELARLWPDLRVVARAGTGEQAVEQALRLRPDLCFLDIRMPGASGLQAAQCLAEDWPDGAPFPLLVFVTAYDQYAVQAFDAQAVDYLVKPVQLARLERCLRRLRERLAARAATPPPEVTLAQLRALLAGLRRRRMWPPIRPSGSASFPTACATPSASRPSRRGRRPCAFTSQRDP